MVFEMGLPKEPLELLVVDFDWKGTFHEPVKIEI